VSSDPDIVVFKASIPPIKSAILISGDGNGGAIKLDIPEIEGNVFADLYRMRGQALIVTISRAAPETPKEPKIASWKTPNQLKK
jgi:hypothetical protein